MKWVNSSAKSDVKFSALNYIDTNGKPSGGVFVNHETGKITWAVGEAIGVGRNVRHAQRVVEKSAK